MSVWDPGTLDEARVSVLGHNGDYDQLTAEHVATIIENLDPAHLPPLPDGPILDFGCGIGRLTIPISEQAPHRKVVGVDQSLRMLAFAAEAGPSLEWRVTLPDDPGRFAAIYSMLTFQHLPDDLRRRVELNATVRTLAPDEVLVQEGEPSRSVFIVKSGLLGVWLEKPSGGSWLVRCCFPGWLLGESSVLGGADAKCTASLRAERISEVWTIPAPALREIMNEDLAFAQRIAETKQLHRIDSFFSMHETMGQLDVQVRDEMLSCIQRLETFADETILLLANEVPDVACLVARGSIGLFEEGKPDKPLAEIEADSFYGVRDTIHRIAPSVMAIARPGTTVAFFDGKRLSKLCERSPENVIAVLERLG